MLGCLTRGGKVASKVPQIYLRITSNLPHFSSSWFKKSSFVYYKSRVERLWRIGLPQIYLKFTSELPQIYLIFPQSNFEVISCTLGRLRFSRRERELIKMGQGKESIK